MLTAEGFPGLISDRMAAETIQLSAEWLARLKEVVPVAANEVFPSEQILDHIPMLIAEIARYLQAPEEEEIAANAAVIEKARELGALRHQQQASVHQLLREFEILGEILEQFVVHEAERLALQPTAAECFAVLRRVTRATRALTRTTVDTFIAEYTTTIQERNERLKNFSRMAGHELRTPLGTLLFAAAALDQPAVRGDAERLSRVIEAIRGNTQRLAHLVENLQRITQLGESADAVNLQQINLGVLAGDVARQLEDMAAARGVSIIVDPDLPDIHIDPARLELVLLNLVSNAIKYCDPEKPHPFVGISASRQDGGRIVVSVHDNGLGVPEHLQHTIFERFSRAHAHLDETLGVSGTGLGLSIVADCVEAVGGTIRCESVAGAGTTFVIVLPAEPSMPPTVPVSF